MSTLDALWYEYDECLSYIPLRFAHNHQCNRACADASCQLPITPITYLRSFLLPFSTLYLKIQQQTRRLRDYWTHFFVLPFDAFDLCGRGEKGKRRSRKTVDNCTHNKYYAQKTVWNVHKFILIIIMRLLPRNMFPFKIEFLVHFIDRLNVDDEFYQNDFGEITDGIASL